MNVFNFSDYAKKKRVGIKDSKRILSSTRTNEFLLADQELHSVLFFGNIFCSQRKYSDGITRLGSVKGQCFFVIDGEKRIGRFEISRFQIELFLENSVGICKVMKHCIQKPVGDIETYKNEKLGFHKFEMSKTCLFRDSEQHSYFVQELKQYFVKRYKKDIEDVYNTEMLWA